MKYFVFTTPLLIAASETCKGERYDSTFNTARLNKKEIFELKIQIFWIWDFTLNRRSWQYTVVEGISPAGGAGGRSSIKVSVSRLPLPVQCTAMHCNVVQFSAMHRLQCNIMQCTNSFLSKAQYIKRYCNQSQPPPLASVMHCNALNVLECSAMHPMHCNAVQCTQRTAMWCNPPNAMYCDVDLKGLY